MEPNIVLVETKDGVATVTLNRPESLNALSRALVSEISRTFEELRNDDAVEVVILTGAGRAFSAGVDLKELSNTERQENTAVSQSSTNRILRATRAFDRPIIGAINGYAITGGFELALMCDILIASTEARFADTHARVGIAPGWGLSQKLPRLIGISRAKELHFTGNFLDAEQAERWGLVNRVVAPDQLLPTCQELARDMLGCDRRTLRAYKRMVDDGYELTFGDGMKMEARASQEHMRGVTAEAVADRREKIQARGRQQSGDDA